MDVNRLGDTAILEEIGQRLSRQRVAANLTQAELARRAGVGRSTVERLESGHSTQLANFVRILRALKLLDAVVGALPEPGVSPMALLEAKSRERKRARRTGVTGSKPGGTWRWGDQE